MSSSTEGGDPATLQQIDRLVSASSPSDALDSIQSLLASVKNPLNGNESNNDEETSSRLVSIICTLCESVEFTTALCTLLSSSEIGTMAVEDGDSTASELLSQLINCLSNDNSDGKNKPNSSSKASAHISSSIQRNTRFSILKKFLSQPSEGRLIHSLLDLLSPDISNSNSGNMNSSSSTPSKPLYARTNALQILSQLTLTLPTLLHSQILAAPNGLHRIVDLISSDDANDESIRNEAILVCTDLAKTNVASARLMIFSDTYQKVLLGVAQEEFRMKNEALMRLEQAGGGGGSISWGGMGWTVVVGDCLRLCIEMTRQVEMGADEFLGSRLLVDTLAGFLDLRFGKSFRCPEEDEAMVEDGDDLDAILGSGDEGASAATDSGSKNFRVPYLTEEEASVIKLALELLQILILGDESNNSTSNGTTNKSKLQSRLRSILSHNTLSSLLFDMALYTLPPPNSPHSLYVSAVPPLQVQLTALDVMTALAQGSDEEVQNTILRSPSIYFQDSGVLERLMYLICTGGGGSSGGGTATMIQIGMHTLGVLRCVLSPKEASLMVWDTLAPPPPTTDGTAEEEDGGRGRGGMEPVVQKLVNTLGGNLLHLIHPEVSKQMAWSDREIMNLNIIGAAGALGVFLTNGAGETTREMLLRVPLPPAPSYLTEKEEGDGAVVSKGQPNDSDSNAVVPESLVECMLSYLEIVTNDEDNDDKSSQENNNNSNVGRKQMKLTSYVKDSLLRMLIEWIPSNPTLVTAILSSASSVVLGVLLQKKIRKKKARSSTPSPPPTAQALTGILLGLCMETMQPDDEIGGWSRSSIMNLINVGMGISKFTQLLEGIKPYIALNPDSVNGTSVSDVVAVGPWACCKWERRVFSKWYDENVIIIRRRAVQQLTFSSNSDNSDGESDDDNDDSGSTDGDKRDLKSMGKLVSQQAEEINNLRQKMSKTEQTMEAQSVEMKMLQKRMQSNPTQLDDMLDEYQSKIAELEKEKKALVNEAIDKQEEHTSQLREKDDQISDLRQLADKSREEIVNGCKEMDSVKEELAGLSSAYASLEIEYNRVTGATTAAESGETSEQTSSSQSNGDNTTEVSTSIPEFNALRTENAKLKKDILAANEWIKLAVKKIDDADQINSSLRAEVEQSKLENNSLSTTQSDLDLWRSKVKSLEESLQKSERSLSELKLQSSNGNVIDEGEINKMNEVEKHRDELSDKVMCLQQELAEKNTDIEQLKLENNSLSTAQSDLDFWRSKVKSMEESLQISERSLSELKLQSSNGKFIDEEEINKMKEVEKHRGELSDKVMCLQQELTEKNMDIRDAEERIHEVELRLSEAATNFEGGKEEKDKLREEIKALSAANKVAQDWMSKAMKHSENQKQKLDEIMRKNADLTSSLQEAEEMLAAERPSITKISFLEKKVTTLATVRDEVREKLASLEQQLSEKEQELQSSFTFEEKEKKEREQEIQNLTERLESRDSETQELRSSMAASQKVIDAERKKVKELEKSLEEVSASCNLAEQEKCSIKDEYDSAIAEREEQCTAFLALQNEIEMVKAENDNLSSEREGHLLAIEDMRSKVYDFQSWTDNAQQRISDLEAEKDDANKKMVALEEEIVQMTNKSNILSKSAAETKNELELNYIEKEKIEEEQKKLRSEISSLTLQIDTISEKNMALTEDKDVLNNEMTELRSNAKNVVELEDSLLQEKNKVIDLVNELESTRQELEEARNEYETTVRQWQEKNNVVQSDLQAATSALEQHEREATEAKSYWQSKCMSLETTSSNLSAELQKANSSIKAFKEENQEWQKSNDKMKSDLQIATSTLEQQNREAIDAKSQLQSQYMSLEKVSNNLSAELQQANSNNEAIKEESVNIKQSIAAVTKLLELERQGKSNLEYENKVAIKDFESRVDELELSISEHIETIDEYQVQLDERDGTIVCAEERIEELTKELVEITEQSEDVVKKWQENSQQLEGSISELESALETQHKEADEAISQWENRCNALSEQVETLEDQLNDGAMMKRISTLESQLCQKNKDLQHKNSNLVDLDSSLSKMKIKLAELQDIEAAHRNVKDELYALTESHDKLNKQFSVVQEKLRDELSGKAQLKMEMQNILQEKEEVVDRLKENDINANNGEGIRDSDKGAISKFQEKIDNLQSLLDVSTAKLERAEEMKTEAEKMLEDEKKFYSDMIDELEEEKSQLNDVIDNNEAEAREMKHMITELEDELLEANDALQSHITDEVSMRATEMATKALQAQLKDLREKQIAEHAAFVSEKEARLSAEEEIERMKVDVSLLIQNDDDGSGDPIDGQIRKLTSKAANAIVRKDREEIESVRTSLDRVMQELSSCRAKERDAEERASNSCLQLSVCEQELTAAKSDIAFLKQAMDDLNVESTNTRSSLEDRIKSIEYDRAVLIRSHVNERETMKAEITRGQMEKERLMHTLSESEKANSTLVYSTTIQKGTDGSSDETELAKLRLEKAQLLASASENGAKFERRIREAIAANASSAEAEIIMEKKLRESAELALAEMQKKKEELSSCLKTIDTNSLSPNKDSCASTCINTAETEKWKTSINNLKQELSQIRDENSMLQMKLEKVEEEAKTEATRLKNECRQMEIKYREIEREEHLEATVAAEVARLNAESTPQRKLRNDIDSNNSEILSSFDGDNDNEDDDEDEYKETDMDGSEMYGYISQLKDAVKEERENYHDLLTEHEDLLALLAQQDLERASLQNALSDFGGENAVERAVTEAEEKAVEQFGKYIRVK